MNNTNYIIAQTSFFRSTNKLFYAKRLTIILYFANIPVYKTPSELLHGEVATNSGMVKGSFLGGSFRPPSKYNDPSLGSGSNTGVIASCVLAGTLTIGSKTYYETHFSKNDCLLTVFDSPSYGTSLLLYGN